MNLKLVTLLSLSLVLASENSATESTVSVKDTAKSFMARVEAQKTPQPPAARVVGHLKSKELSPFIRHPQEEEKVKHSGGASWKQKQQRLKEEEDAARRAEEEAEVKRKEGAKQRQAEASKTLQVVAKEMAKEREHTAGQMTKENQDKTHQRIITEIGTDYSGDIHDKAEQLQSKLGGKPNPKAVKSEASESNDDFQLVPAQKIPAEFSKVIHDFHALAESASSSPQFKQNAALIEQELKSIQHVSNTSGISPAQITMLMLLLGILAAIFRNAM